MSCKRIEKNIERQFFNTYALDKCKLLAYLSINVKSAFELNSTTPENSNHENKNNPLCDLRIICDGVCLQKEKR